LSHVAIGEELHKRVEIAENVVCSESRDRTDLGQLLSFETPESP